MFVSLLVNAPAPLKEVCLQYHLIFDDVKCYNPAMTKLPEDYARKLTLDETPRVEFIDLPDLLTTRDVASYFRVAPLTVIRWARSGKIGCLKKNGRIWRYRKEDVAKLLEEVR